MYPTKEEILKEVRGFERIYSLSKYNIKRKLFNIAKDKTVFFFSKENDLNNLAKEYYMYNYAEKFEIINNILKDDTSINYKVYYNINNIEDIFNMNILYGNDIKIYDKFFNNIIEIGTKGQKYLNCIAQNIDINREQQIFLKIIKEYKSDEKNTLKYLYEIYIKEFETYKALNDIICWDYRFNKFNNSMDAVCNAYEKRDMIVKKILGLPLNIKLKNTSELMLYRIVKDLFKDAVYQYRAEWLGRQSLDIYIPSKRIAFEYQGEQHYNAIEFFGGEEALIKRKQLDYRKKELCKQNNVKLIEWNYTEIINTENLIQKLQKLLLM